MITTRDYKVHLGLQANRLIHYRDCEYASIRILIDQPGFHINVCILGTAAHRTADEREVLRQILSEVETLEVGMGKRCKPPWFSTQLGPWRKKPGLLEARSMWAWTFLCAWLHMHRNWKMFMCWMCCHSATSLRVSVLPLPFTSNFGTISWNCTKKLI